MGNFKKFSDFLENKIDSENKGNKEYPPIDVKDSLAGEDYDGPLATKPPQGPTKGKNDKALPYKADGEIAKNVAWTANDEGKKKGFGWEATPGMTPQTSSLGKAVEDKSKPLPKPKKKLKTEQFIETTKDMSDGEFVNYILEQHDTSLSTVTDLFGNEFTPDPTQTIQYVAGLMLGNPMFMDKLIREVKRRDGLAMLMKELMEHGDTYDHMVEHLEEPEFGIDRANKLARTMNDRHMALFDNFDLGDEDEADDFGESVVESTGPNLEQMIGGRMPNQGSPGASPGGALPGGAFGGGSQDQGGVFSANKQPNVPPVGPNPSNVQTGGAGMPQFAGPNGTMQPPIPAMRKGMDSGDKHPKVKSGSAGKTLLGELAMFKHFKEHMKSLCADC